jgi:hypothetical protein
MNQPQPKATTREALREQYGFTKRTFARMLKRAGIIHRRTVLTPKEVGQCYAYLVEQPSTAANDANAPTRAN